MQKKQSKASAISKNKVKDGSKITFVSSKTAIFSIAALSLLAIVGGYYIWQSNETFATRNGDRDEVFTSAVADDLNFTEVEFTTSENNRCVALEYNSNFNIGGIGNLKLLNTSTVGYKVNSDIVPGVENPNGDLSIYIPGSKADSKKVLINAPRGGLSYPVDVAKDFSFTTLVKDVPRSELQTKYTFPADRVATVLTASRLRLISANPNQGVLSLSVYRRPNSKIFVELGQYNMVNKIYTLLQRNDITSKIELPFSDGSVRNMARLRMDRSTKDVTTVFPSIEILDSETGIVISKIELRSKRFAGIVEPQLVVRANWQTTVKQFQIDDFNLKSSCTIAQTGTRSTTFTDIEDFEIVE